MVKSIKIISDDSNTDNVPDIKDFYDVEEFVIEKLQIQQRPVGMKVYKLEQVGGCDQISHTDTIVAECPEAFVRKQVSAEIVALRQELKQLRERVAVSDILREDALCTVNRLRQEVLEFSNINESMSPRGSLKRNRNRRYSSAYPNSSRGSSQSTSRAVWRN